MTTDHHAVDGEGFDVDRFIGEQWPLDGPYSADQTTTAASTMSELVRYLNYATTGRRARDAMPGPATAYDLVGYLHATAARLGQTFDQLIRYLGNLQSKDQPALYDEDHHDDPLAAGERLAEAMVALTRASASVASAHQALSEAHSALGRIGVRSPDAPGDV